LAAVGYHSSHPVNATKVWPKLASRQLALLYYDCHYGYRQIKPVNGQRIEPDTPQEQVQQTKSKKNCAMEMSLE